MDLSLEAHRCCTRPIAAGNLEGHACSVRVESGTPKAKLWCGVWLCRKTSIAEGAGLSICLPHAIELGIVHGLLPEPIQTYCEGCGVRIACRERREAGDTAAVMNWLPLDLLDEKKLNARTRAMFEAYGNGYPSSARERGQSGVFLCSECRDDLKPQDQKVTEIDPSKLLISAVARFGSCAICLRVGRHPIYGPIQVYKYGEVPVLAHRECVSENRALEGSRFSNGDLLGEANFCDESELLSIFRIEYRRRIVVGGGIP